MESEYCFCCGQEIPKTEEEVIQEKIKIVAEKEATFRRVGIYDYYNGEHISWLWQEQLDAMVASGELYTDSKGNYSAKPFEPEEVWEDVTGECCATLERYGEGLDFALPILRHSGFIIAHLTDVDEEGNFWQSMPGSYKIERFGSRIKVLKKAQ